jgi:putative tryptophan/tyrosine transport system substrate-binding protein
MRRRDFITLLGGAAAAWPRAASAQQAGKLPTIGVLGTEVTVWAPWTAAFVARLRALGWIEARTIAIEYRWCEGRPERMAEIAAEFVRLKVDVIVTNGFHVPTLKRATAVIPVVFALAIDPVGGGLVASLARPGGNVTGLSFQATDTAGNHWNRGSLSKTNKAPSRLDERAWEFGPSAADDPRPHAAHSARGPMLMATPH